MIDRGRMTNSTCITKYTTNNYQIDSLIYQLNIDH